MTSKRAVLALLAVACAFAGTPFAAHAEEALPTHAGTTATTMVTVSGEEQHLVQNPPDRQEEAADKQPARLSSSLDETGDRDAAQRIAAFVTFAVATLTAGGGALAAKSRRQR